MIWKHYVKPGLIRIGRITAEMDSTETRQDTSLALSGL